MTFDYKLTVRGYELDSFNHVNNAVYLSYFEQARWEFFKHYDLFDYFEKNQYLPVVTDIHIRYPREARLFDELLVKTMAEREDPYVIFKQKIYNIKTELKICEASVKMLLINKNRMPVGIPDELQRIITEKNLKK